MPNLLLQLSLDIIELAFLSPAFALLIYGIAQIATHGGFIFH